MKQQFSMRRIACMFFSPKVLLAFSRRPNRFWAALSLPQIGILSSVLGSPFFSCLIKNATAVAPDACASRLLDIGEENGVKEAALVDRYPVASARNVVDARLQFDFMDDGSSGMVKGHGHVAHRVYGHQERPTG